MNEIIQAISDSLVQDMDDTEGTFVVSLVTLGQTNLNGLRWEKSVKLRQKQVDISSHAHRANGLDIFVPADAEVGAGTLYKADGMIMMRGQYNLDIAEGEAAYKRAAFKSERGLRQAWSITAYMNNYKWQREGDEDYLSLKEATPFEASPVPIGADTNAELKTVQSLRPADTPEVEAAVEPILWLPEIHSEFSREVRR